MGRVGKDGGYPRDDLIAVSGEDVLQPVQGLNDAHRRPTGPVQLAWRGELELDRQIAERYRPPPRVGVGDDARRDGGGEPQVVRCRQSVDQHPHLIAPREGIEDLAVIHGAWLLCQCAGSRTVVQPSADSPERSGAGETLQCLVDSVPRAEIEKIDRGPDRCRVGRLDAGTDEVCYVRHCRLIFVHIFRTTSVLPCSSCHCTRSGICLHFSDMAVRRRCVVPKIDSSVSAQAISADRVGQPTQKPGAKVERSGTGLLKRPPSGSADVRQRRGHARRVVEAGGPGDAVARGTGGPPFLTIVRIKALSPVPNPSRGAKRGPQRLVPAGRGRVELTERYGP